MSLTHNQMVNQALSSPDGVDAMLKLLTVLEKHDVRIKTVKLVVVAPDKPRAPVLIKAGTFFDSLEIWTEEDR